MTMPPEPEQPAEQPPADEQPAEQPPPEGEQPDDQAADEQPADDQAESDEPKRPTITGVLVTYGVPAMPAGPYSIVIFAPGSIELPEDLSRVKLLRDHDDTTPVGVMTGAQDSPEMLTGTFSLGTSKAATDALTELQEGILDGLSVGVEVLEMDQPEGEPALIKAARLVEVSMVALPAYDDARVTDIAARRRTEGRPMPELTIVPTTPPADLNERIRAVVDAELTAGRAPAGAAPAVPEHPAGVRTAAAAAAAAPGGLHIDAQGYGRRAPAFITASGERITGGDWCAAFFEGRRTGDYTAFSRINAALANEGTAQVPGLLPQQIVGPILGTVEPARRVWNSLAVKVMPTISNKFQRPKIVQHTAVDTQAAEFTEVASQQLTVQLDDVVKATIAGALRLSVQTIDWSSPGMLDMVIADFARVYAVRTDLYAAAALEAAAATNTAITADPADPAAVNAALYEAAQAVYDSGTDYDDPYPNSVWMATDVWATLGGQADADKRPIYPYLGPNNTLTIMDPGDPESESPFGSLRRIVSKRFTAGTFVVGDSDMLEMYEDRRGMLRAEEPAPLAVQLATYGYVGKYPVINAAFQPIALTPPPPLARSGKGDK